MWSSQTDIRVKETIPGREAEPMEGQAALISE